MAPTRNRSTRARADASYCDPETEEFLAVARGTDYVDGGCSGGGFWPVEVECNEASFTEFICDRPA